MELKRICVNCGCQPGSDPEYAAAARLLGEALVEHGIELVYGGARVGLMGEVADTVLRHGGTVTGVIPKSFAHREAQAGLTEFLTTGMDDATGKMADGLKLAAESIDSGKAREKLDGLVKLTNA